MEKTGSLHVSFKDLTGELLAEMRLHSSLSVGHIAAKLAEKVPLPAGKVYRLVCGVEPLPPSDALSKHVSGETAELTACADSEDSESSDDKPQKDKKAAKSGKSSKDKKKKDKKGKKKKDKSSKKTKCKSSEEEAPVKKKPKVTNEQGADFAEDRTDRAVWVKEKIDELRQISPPLPIEACILRAKKEWVEFCENAAEVKAKEEDDRLPQVVKDAVKQAGDEARAKGKSEEEVQTEMDIARHFSTKVAKDAGLWKEAELEEDPTKVPLYFQKRPGLERAIHALQALDD